MIVLSGAAAPLSKPSLSSAFSLMLLEAGCWLNGSKLQENEAKKKVMRARSVDRMRSPVQLLTAFAQELRRLGGRAAQ
jgi:hypothetical protein